MTTNKPKNANPTRLTGVRNAKLIENQEMLTEAYNNMLKPWNSWVFEANIPWEENGFMLKDGYIYVPNRTNGKTGEVVASIGDYIVNFNNGKKVIVYTPEMKERVARGDFSWAV